MSNKLIQLKDGTDNVFIKVGDLFLRERKAIPNVSIDANEIKALDFDITKSGYKPICCTGVVLPTGNCVMFEHYFASETRYHALVKNYGSATTGSISIDIVYLKNS